MKGRDRRSRLTGDQYRVLVEKGTEPPFSGTLLHNKETGSYTCAACGAELFKSEHKYDSKQPGLAGWPSFAEVADSGAVKLSDDSSFGMRRIEVQCARCGGHLGHLFDDNSSPTGKHYCINSVSLCFVQQNKKQKSKNRQ